MMKWSNVRLIFLREARDQLRDRRTLFTIAVLPLVLYPLLGMTFFQISQFMQENPSQIWIVGSEFLPSDPPLLDGDQLALGLATEEEAHLLNLTVEPFPQVDSDSIESAAQSELKDGGYDLVVYFPPSFSDQLKSFHEQVAQRRKQGRAANTSNAPSRDELQRDELQPDELQPDELRPEQQWTSIVTPQPKIFYNTADDKSRIAYERFNRILRGWRQGMVQSTLIENQIPLEATEPFRIVETDVAEDQSRRAAAWSKILPFVLLVWALTGAFYPAVDLCAGEKERGTLETLLSSPARRSEIVWGKLLTVMCFSMATSILNLASMGVTGVFIIRQLGALGGGLAMGPPPIASMGWLLLGLPPISALFSALALAIAAFARSSREGQYYLLPLLLITLPLMMLPMLPAAEMNLGTALVPVSGMMMLLRSLIEGQYAKALIYAPPVAIVTGACCLFAIRWAVDQFRNESVLFRESDQFGVGIWMRHVMRDRGETPSVAEGVACGVILLMIRFFAGFVTPAPTNWNHMVALMCITQLAVIATPALMMTIILTRNPAKTLLLRAPKLAAVPAAILLAIGIHPAMLWISECIKSLYPISADTMEQLRPFSTLIAEAPLLSVVLVLALVPAVCEELAFRGFILSGLRHLGHKWTAIALASLFFGLAHGILQQSLAACVAGMVIGYVAVQTGSLAPAIAFHFTHNALAVCVSRVAADSSSPLGRLISATEGAGLAYHWAVTLAGAALAVGMLHYFRRQKPLAYEEEELQTALIHGRSEEAGAVAS